MTYFEAGEAEGSLATSPQEQLDAFLQDNGYRFDGLEDGTQSVEDVLAGSTLLESAIARKLARVVLKRIESDAATVPKAALKAALDRCGIDPLALSAELGAPVSIVLRRLASCGELEAGLVVCDRAGSILFRKPVGQMVIPRFGAACALWPLFEALCQPGQVVRTPLVQIGRGRAHFDCFAVAEVVGEMRYNAPPLIEASMLLISGNAPDNEKALEVGATCGVCPKRDCTGRREPSILMDGL